MHYTQYPIIRNGHIRHAAEISGKFKKPLLKGSNLRNALKCLGNVYWSPFLFKETITFSLSAVVPRKISKRVNYDAMHSGDLNEYD